MLLYWSSKRRCCIKFQAERGDYCIEYVHNTEAGLSVRLKTSLNETSESRCRRPELEESLKNDDILFYEEVESCRVEDVK